MKVRLIKTFADIPSAIEEVLATSWSLGMSDMKSFESCKTAQDILEVLKNLKEEYREFESMPAVPKISLETDGDNVRFSYQTASGTNEVLLFLSTLYAPSCSATYVVFSHAEDPYESSAVKAFRSRGWGVWDWEK